MRLIGRFSWALVDIPRVRLVLTSSRPKPIRGFAMHLLVKAVRNWTWTPGGIVVPVLMVSVITISWTACLVLDEAVGLAKKVTGRLWAEGGPSFHHAAR